MIGTRREAPVDCAGNAEIAPPGLQRASVVNSEG